VGLLAAGALGHWLEKQVNNDWQVRQGWNSKLTVDG
jgi:hypothetical protein